MKVIKPSFEIISLQNPTEKIERVARVCYKSEDKIGEGTAEKMVKALIQREHNAMLEHASICVVVDAHVYNSFRIWLEDIEHHTGFTCFLRLSRINAPIISGNIRAWSDAIKELKVNGYSVPRALVDLLLSDKYKIYFEKTLSDIHMTSGSRFTVTEIDPSTLSRTERTIHEDRTVLFTVDRGVSHEIVRHRPVSYAQESTRYCNYNQGKFDGELTVIKPLFFEEGTPEYLAWYSACEFAERQYMELISMGRSAQEARSVLPHSLKTEIVATMNLHRWIHFFNLRALGTTGAPHPQMKEIALPVLEAFAEALPEIFAAQYEKAIFE